jgi:hypothetical protein
MGHPSVVCIGGQPLSPTNENAIGTILSSFPLPTLVVKYELRFELRLRRNLILRVITSHYVRNISHDSDYGILRHFLLRSPKYE